MAKIQELQDKWMALSKRERWMIFGAGLIGVVGMIDTFMLEPLRQQNNSAQEQTFKLQEDVTKVQKQITDLKVSAQGGKTGHQLEMDAIKDKLKLQQDAMANMSALMVKPNEVLPLLRDLLKKHDEVEVIGLESLPVDNFIKKHALAAKNEQASGATVQADNQGANAADENVLNQVYQHTIKLTVRGNYQAVMNYAYDLKKHAGVLSWESAEMKAQYPKTELKIHLYTLSLQNVWLGI
jgi:MSHA biogenesis protein MshJ